MQCPACGYFLSAFEKTCPRCELIRQKQSASISAPTPQANPLPPPPLGTYGTPSAANAVQPPPASSFDPTLSFDAPVQPATTDLCAVLSVVLGGLGVLFLSCLFGPAALILGVVSLVRLKDNPNLKGSGFAYSGLAMGALCVAVAAFNINSAVEQFQGVGGGSLDTTPQAIGTPGTTAGSAQAPPGAIGTVGDLSVMTMNGTPGLFGGNISGNLVNNGGRSYSSVMIEFNLYDDQGNQVGSAMDIVRNLEPRGTWAYKALVLESRAVRFKLKDITAF
jgi:hypothetical protein